MGSTPNIKMHIYLECHIPAKSWVGCIIDFVESSERVGGVGNGGIGSPISNKIII